MKNLIIVSVIVAAPLAAAIDTTYEIVDLSELIPGVSDAAAFDISPNGAVVGSVRIGGGEQMIGRWSDSTGEVLDSDFGSEYAQAISDDGVIVGYGRRDGVPGRRAFLLRPPAIFGSDFERGDHVDWSLASGK